MQTIASVTVDPVYLKPTQGSDQMRVETRRAYSIDGYSPVIVTIRVGAERAVVHTTCAPSGALGWWREPDATTRRHLLDEVLTPLGLRRTGKCYEPSADEWYHTYPIGPA